ncbi:hypothetical protein [Micromonospora sp. RP3T]|uniref:hypothetical protein n=1 Tax=Micromonospora sp. RP3T TaxID=2135446 RepID=UPI0013049902|nr:hypothetical protein [Micromonospora sp. RP3T]
MRGNLVGQPVGVVAGGDEQRPGGVGTDAVLLEQLCAGGDGGAHLLLQGAGLVGERQDAAGQAAQDGGGRSHIVGNHGTSWERIKAATGVYAGRGLDREVRPKGLEPLTF